MVKRYVGLEIFDESKIKPILKGNQTVTEVRQTKPYNDVYQAGWNAMVSFRRSGNHFENFGAALLTPNTPIQPTQGMTQVVTRGVDTCTVIAAKRGDYCCLLHIDFDDKPDRKAEALEFVNSQMTKGTGDIYIVSSYINTEFELDVADAIFQRCSRVATVSNHIKIDRGKIVPTVSYMSHVEIGIAINSGAVMFYGDKIWSDDWNRIDSTFEFGFDTAQATIDNAMWRER